jgi:hypothetical protein
MRQASIALLTAWFLVLFAIPAAAQTTKPSADLARENVELRAYAEKLESRIAELEAKLKEQKKDSSPRLEIRPFMPAPYGYQLPAVPFRIPTPTPAPRLPEMKPPMSRDLIPALPRQSAPEQWKRHEFNGQEFYLVPLQ